jgi:beta-galactosidase
VPTANPQVFFEFSGAGSNAGVGNGDPSCHEANQANSRSAFMGYCMVLAQAGRKAGALKITASANGLTSASVQLMVANATGG